MTQAQTQPAQNPPPMRKETPEHTERIAWWREAKFGMFIHWGIYAVPAGTWKGQQIAGIGEWIMNRAKIPVKEYEQLAAQFNPVKFNADEWAQLAQDAGMKYMVITSKHHDGFAMYHTKVNKYNIVDATPFKRDPMIELAAACKKRGIKFGFYYSQSQDWHEPGGMGNTWDFGPDAEKASSGAYDNYLKETAEPQVKEILTQYGDICLVWFDTPREMNADRAKRLHDIVRELQPKCLIDGRLGGGPDLSDYDSEGDNRIPGEIRRGDWETPATLNDTWGYKSYDDKWKKPDDLVFKLVDIVSKGGNYLLNVGPTAEGVIPQPSQDALRAVGKWMKINGEAVYGCGPTPFGAELGKATDQKDSRGRVIYDVYKDWRCTTKGDKMYIHLFKWPGATFDLPFAKRMSRAYMLTDTSQTPLEVAQSPGKTTIKLPAAPTSDYASVLVLELSQ